ncbi:DUF2147 domain-containing protein [Rhodobacteraceae bacterium CCMM004]|nr:DUF2147 domain-containing protein [Rhodobacteraceae bacterium CCMM004]
MKRIALAAAAALSLIAAPAMAEPLMGTWLTAQDDNGNSGLIRVAPCGAALCGTLVKAYDSAGREMSSPNIGRQIISATKPVGGGEYRGKVWSPDRDKTYNSKLTLSGDRLSVEGCVLGICRNGGTWRRAN